MYHPIEIERLSENQVKKMVKGHPVRVKHGKGHVIHASPEQHKKIAKAHMKGKGVTVQLDPYQCQHHLGLVGTGFMSTVKRAYGHAKKAYGHAKEAVGRASQFYGEHKEQLEPYGNILKRQASTKVEHYAEKAQPHLSKHLGEFGTHLGQHARESALSHINQFGELPVEALPYEEQLYPAIESPAEIEHEMGGRLRRRRHVGGKINFGNIAKSGLKSVSNFAKTPQGQALMRQGAEMAISAASGAGMMGGTVRHRRRGRPRGRGMENAMFHGGALMASGY